jgi:Spy/CpxP family protein refolding chaperone
MKRIFLAALLAMTVAAALVAQRAQRGPGDRNPVTAFKNALDLTDAQVTTITALFQAEKSRTEAIRTEIQQKRTTLESLLNGASPAPADVGNAAIALHASEAKMKAEHDALIRQVKQQLTGEQQQKLDALLASNGGRGLLPGLRGPGGPNRGGRGNTQ